MIVSAIGNYASHLDQDVLELQNTLVLQNLQNVINQRKTIYEDNSLFSFFENKTGKESIIFLTPIDPMNEFDKKMLKIFFNNVSIALDNIFLNREIEMTQKEIIFTLGEITESRSNETGHHVKRVAEYSKLIALKCGISENESEMIRLASPMHDKGGCILKSRNFISRI